MSWSSKLKLPFRYSFRWSACLEDDVETLLRRYATKDALYHRLANVHRSRPEARHGEREEESPALRWRLSAAETLCDVVRHVTKGGPIEPWWLRGRRHCNSSPDAFARRCGWHPAINHPLDSHATRKPEESLRTVISAARGSYSALHEPRTHISNPTTSGGVAVHLVCPCRILQTRARGMKGACISWKLWKAPRKSRYLESTRPRQLGISSGCRMRFIQQNGGR